MLIEICKMWSYIYLNFKMAASKMKIMQYFQC